MKLIKNYKIPNEIISLLSPFTSRAYIVGGACRDILMGKTPTDIDIEIYDISIKNFEKIMKQIGAKGVGKKFFVYKYKNFDFSLPRTESKITYGHTGFEVELTQDEKIASLRRDFTMNAIMLNIFDKKILDFWGGINDIQNKTIRLINAEKFKEDSLRVLRAMQFSARFGFKIEKNTADICKNIALDDLSKDRIYKEFEKMFYSKYLFYGFYYFVKMDIDLKIFGVKFDNCKLLYKFRKNPHPAYFLYHIKQFHKINFSFFPKKIKNIAKMKKKPNKVTNRFLYALSLRHPLQIWSVLNDDCAKIWLINNNIYTNKYKPLLIDKNNPKKSILKEIRNKPLQFICNS